ncbi:Lysophospholipid acyltransferase 2 [Schistosoma japonicum]|uniref:Lysophospholipid acyltransferase 2 n=1 Tax=Schistosoma japonicum TaxID=6182 RepID=A0A4Z2D3K6_SCHJA|nr:Lysophospholipid acyltransferase 2 [Schistosoma japonicum]TNN11081.1 Lysophospholipid acyltransferase 2 [Schistosoma japonicum]
MGVFSYLSVVDEEHWRFLICQLLTLLSGCVMQKCIPPCSENSRRRHLFEFVSGFVILYLAYGYLVIHMFAQAIPAYIMMVLLPLSVAQYGILVFSMIYLSAVHIHRFMYNPLLDITAPLMVQTQKLSSLAFNINDGVKLAKEGTVDREYHKLNAVERRPRLLQLGGYLFSFHNVMIGPFNFFADYVRFIHGEESNRFLDPTDKKRFEDNKEAIRSAKTEKWKQMKLLLLHTILIIWAFSSFKPEYFLSEEFAKKNYFQKYIYLSIACFGFRQRFYFAWTLSCLSNLIAGFGFSGFNSRGEPEYRLATNIYFLSIELGTSTKTILDSWNTATTRWLRECIYDRVPKRYAVWAVFIVSAMWHGFYPGYYLAFVSAALITVAGRVCRKHLRPFFLRSSGLHCFYDVLTNLSAMLCLNYLGVPFLLLNTDKVLYFWRQMRFIGHIGPLALIIGLPLLCGKPGEL